MIVVENGGCNTSHSKRVEQAFYSKYTGKYFISISLLNRYFIAIIYMSLWVFKRHFSTIFQLYIDL